MHITDRVFNSDILCWYKAKCVHRERYNLLLNERSTVYKY